MDRNRLAGLLLIAGAVLSAIVLAMHPTGGEILRAEDFARASRGNAVVHSLALAAIPLVFLGLMGLTRRLETPETARAALVVYGFGAVALMGAAVMSGFVTGPVFERILDAGPDENTFRALGHYTGLINQGFAKVAVGASAVSIALFGFGIARTGRLQRAVGWVGVVLGIVILAALASGHLTLDVHGFGAVTFGQGGWFVWVGVLLMRRS